MIPSKTIVSNLESSVSDVLSLEKNVGLTRSCDADRHTKFLGEKAAFHLVLHVVK